MRAFGAVCGAAVAAALVLFAARPADAALATPGFRAVGVAHAAFPVSAMAVAPDGRLFVAVQALGQATGSAEIRVYSAYSTNDGSVLDTGALWATVDGVRATATEEGLLGIALAPDFETSGLVYVYLSTTDESANQHVRVYHETAGGTGEYLGTVQTGLEPPTESTNRNGGPLAFGVDGCLYAGVGDNGGGNRWNAQLLRGTDPLRSSENDPLCNAVCLGTSLYPDRTVANNGEPNHAGKILRMAVAGASPAAPAPGAPLASQPLVFGAGLRNPVGLAVHPLTGQLYASERGDSQEPEVDVVDTGSNLGWPCLEGSMVSAPGVAACLAGHAADEVYGNHPAWRRPVATHTGNPAVSALSAYTGLGYPAEFYGDVFYLLRDSARIYRLDLEPPCFLPHPNGMTPVAFHDSTDDDDFTVTSDFDGDGEFEDRSFRTFTAVVQGPDPLGRQVLYVAGKQGNSSALDEDTVIFRLEFATAFTPYGGPAGRVPDSCFTDGVYSGGTGAAPYGYENPFQRGVCQLATGACVGQPDGSPCDTSDACHAASACRDGLCVPGTALPDGTPCPDADPCDGVEQCQSGVCQPGPGPAPLTVRALGVKRELLGPGTGSLKVQASFRPTGAIHPDATDALTLTLADVGGSIFSGVLQHPASDPFWRRPRPGVWKYADAGGSAAGVTTVAMKTRPSGSVKFTLTAGTLDFPGLDEPGVNARLLVGGQCFVADLTGRCVLDSRRLRCWP